MKKCLMLIIFILLTLVFLSLNNFLDLTNLYNSFLDQSEYISFFESNIKLCQNGSVIIRERITLNAQNIYIKHGIYMILPKYNRTNFLIYKYTNPVIYNATIDGKEVSYYLSDDSENYKLRLGNYGIMISKGLHIYETNYKLCNIISKKNGTGIFNFNIAGGVWDFPIKKCKISVEFEEKDLNINDIKFKQIKAYNSRDRNNKNSYFVYFERNAKEKIVFESTTNFVSKKGFKVILKWKDNGTFLKLDSLSKEISKFFLLNNNLKYSFAGIIFLLIYCFITWYFFGKDPELKEVYKENLDIIDRLSPEEILYLKNMKFDTDFLNLALIDMALKNYIKIDLNEGYFILYKKAKDKLKLSVVEKIICKNFFFGDLKEFLLGPESKDIYKETIKEIKEYLKLKYKDYFRSNKILVYIGILISIFIFFIPFFSQSLEFIITFMFFCNIIFLLLAFLYINSIIIKNLKDINLLEKIKFLFIDIIYLFVLSLFFKKTLFLYIDNDLLLNIIFAIILLIIIGINLIFIKCIKKPVKKNLYIFEEIKYLENFFNSCIKNRSLNIDTLHSSFKNDAIHKDLYSLVPYAIALDISSEWFILCDEYSRSNNFIKDTNIIFSFNFGNETNFSFLNLHATFKNFSNIINNIATNNKHSSFSNLFSGIKGGGGW